MGLFPELWKVVIPSMASTVVGYGLFMSPLLLYLLARWRQHRDANADPQLGIKLVLGYFAIVGCQVALLGGTLLLYAIVSKDEDRGGMVRVAFGFLIPSLAVWFAHRALLARTNQDAYPGVRRLLAGYNLLVVGVIGFTALVMTFQALFAKGSSGEGGRLAVAALLVYGTAWAFNGWRVFVDRTGATSPPPLSPSMVMPSTSTDPAASPAPTTPGLPSLGGGSFPPIGPR